MRKSLVPVETHEHGYFRSHDGLKLFYAIRGPKNAPPLLFCYGLVCSKLQWKYQIEHFSRTHRVIYFDYRGHNKSESPKEASSMTIANLARDVATLHDELRLPPLPVLGHSLGVNVLLEFYRRYPNKVAGLVLANGTPQNPFETMFGHNFLQVLFPLLPLAHRLMPDIVDKLWTLQGTSPISQKFVSLAGFNTKYAKREDINEYLRITSQVKTRFFVSLLHDFTHYDARLWLDQILVPTLVIGGSRDLVTPPINSRIMAKLIPKAKLQVIHDGSHCVQMEQVEKVNSLIEAFLKELERKKTREKVLKETRRVRV